MNYRYAITGDMLRLLELFNSHPLEAETLDWLRRAVSDRAMWYKAHGVFNHIRSKTMKAERVGNPTAKAQYMFEEVCAKTLHNLCGQAAPFDPDSPYWIVPNAIALGRRLGIPDADVLACISDPSAWLDEN